MNSKEMSSEKILKTATGKKFYKITHIVVRSVMLNIMSVFLYAIFIANLLISNLHVKKERIKAAVKLLRIFLLISMTFILVFVSIYTYITFEDKPLNALSEYYKKYIYLFISYIVVSFIIICFLMHKAFHLKKSSKSRKTYEISVITLFILQLVSHYVIYGLFVHKSLEVV